MLDLLQAFMYMGSQAVMFLLVGLPMVTLLVFCAVYIAAETIHNFRERQGWF